MKNERRIRARIDATALKRSTQMFSGSTEDICGELFQNARRAGATLIQIEVSQSGRASKITISDDGTGCLDPQSLISYGENGWNDALVEAEDAAGMGMLSLASIGCTVHSGKRGADAAWEVTLTPQHFAGAEDAIVVEREAHPRWTTRITFDDTRGPMPHDSPYEAARRAARHLPVPVEWSCTGTDEYGRPIDETRMLERTSFLEGATHHEHWNGIRFGVLRGAERGRGREGGALCFHGMRVERTLPTVAPIRGEPWRARAQIEHCRALKLKLPDRHTVVETPFAAEMDVQARHVIYQAMARDPEAWACHADWAQARAEGVEIPIPPKELRQWSAKTNLDEWTDGPWGWDERHPWTPIDATALIMEHTLETCEAQALERAVKTNGMSQSLFEAEPRLKGYPWYDALPRVTAVAWKASMEGRIMSVSEAAKHTDRRRPDAIWAELYITKGETTAVSIRKMQIGCDVAITESNTWCGAVPLVTANSTIEPNELADMLHRGTFDFCEAPDSDCWETQREESEQQAYEMAVRTLRGETEAIRATLYEIVRREMAWRLPKGHEAVIRFGNTGSEELDVTIRERDA